MSAAVDADVIQGYLPINSEHYSMSLWPDLAVKSQSEQASPRSANVSFVHYDDVVRASRAHAGITAAYLVQLPTSRA
jgi:hypothetical protein